MAAGPPRPSDPKSGGNKQALLDAFASAKSENAPPNEAPTGGAPVDPNDPTEGAPADGPEDAGEGQAVAQLEMQFQHLTNLLIGKGIISPHDVMSVPTIGGPPPGAAPPGAPPMPPQGGPPLQ